MSEHTVLPLFKETGVCEICERTLPIDQLTSSYSGEEGWWGCWPCYEEIVREMKELGHIDGSVRLKHRTGFDSL